MDSIPADAENKDNAINTGGKNQVVTTDMIQVENIREDEVKESSMKGLPRGDDDLDAEDVEKEDIRAEAATDDLLAQQRLILSESTENGNVELEQKSKVDFTRITKRIVDSEDESNVESNKVNNIEVDSDDQEDLLIFRKAKTKFNALLDSDSEDGESTKNSGDGQSHSKVELDSEKELRFSVNAKSKFNGLIDSDSEDEITAKTTSSTVESSKSDVDMDTNDNLKKQKKLNHKSQKISALVDSESDSESNQSQQDDSQHSEAEVLDNENEHHDVVNKSQPKQMRASAKKAMDEMQAIQSEQQRLHREAHISVPYHKPKRHTLQEFLKRRTIQKPLQRDESKPLKSLKMTPEELEEYAKLMEARAKEATEFFKSESEDDEPKNNNFIENTDVENDSKKHVDALALLMDNDENNLSSTETNIDHSAQPIELEYISSTEPEVLTTQPIITEVVELPKLNINTLKIAPPTTTETVFKLIHEKKLPDSPSLKGDPNMLIDLETGDLVAKQPTGVDNLLRRFMAAKAKRKPKTTETLSILSTDNGQLEVSTVNVHIHDEPDQNKETKPGEAYFKLKENLRSIIKKKRLDELEKRNAEKREEEIEYKKCFDDDEEELVDDVDNYDCKWSPKKRNKTSDVLIIDDEENAINLEEDVSTDGEDGNEDYDDTEAWGNVEDIKDIEKIEESAEVIDGEGEDEVEENNDDDEDEDENQDDGDTDDDDANELQSQNGDSSRKKSRIIKAFQADSDEEIDFLRTPTQTKINSEKLFDEKSPTVHPIKDENELLELCSGKFEGTATSVISQIPITQINASGAAVDDELMELCSGTFEDKPDNTQTQTTAAPKKIISTDDEDLSLNEAEPKRLKKLKKRAKKNKAKLGFSDDEDDEETTVAVSISADEESQDSVENDEEVPETFIDYDSEENEIFVEMTKKDCVKQAENFFEKEAELSESEWGSADEDEKHLDKYDIELGDEDEFDKDKLQTELGQIHARKMLDEDIREVRKIQEMLLEDEEKDGVGRQRQFKWKNIENGFSLDDPSGENAHTHGEYGESGDEENEQLWRKIRYEREQLLREKNSKEEFSVSVNNSTLSTTSLGNTTLQSSSVKKINIISAKRIKSNEAKKSSPFLISKSMSALDKKPARGSFLIRDKETLSKLAGLTKGGAQDADGTAGTVAVKAIKPQNFVFATLTEEEHAVLKRKSDDLLNSSAENGINYMKRPKVEPRREKCFIDQLL